MKNVRIGGVPEHFNYSWYLALKQGHFKQKNIEVIGFMGSRKVCIINDS